jgi:FkbM family methyltransferase
VGLKAQLHDTLMERQGSLFARVPLQVMASAVATARSRQLCRMRLDGPHWIHRYGDGVVVTPKSQPDIPTPAEITERMREEFCQLAAPRTGDVVVDVGAGIGEAIPLWASAVGPTGRVIAIEAHPVLYACVEKAVRLNGMANVEVLHAAVTGEPGTVQLSDDPMWYGNTILGEGGTIEVAGRTLDEICEERAVDRVGFLKMNIEGAERPALAGMGRTIERCDAVAISCHDFLADEGSDDWFRTKEPVTRFLTESGFRVATRGDRPNPSTRDVVYGVRE